MTRYFLSCLVLFACLCCLPGCGGGGGPAKFDPSDAEPYDEAEAENYEKQLQEQMDDYDGT